MKFTDGLWLIREGFELIPGVHYFRSYQENGKLKVLVAPRDISHRAMQLDTPILTVEFSSVLKDTISVKVYHHAGVLDRGPEFTIYEQETEVEISETDTEITFTSGKMSAVIQKTGGWQVDYYYDGKRITGSGFKAMAHVTGPDKTTYMKEELDLTVGEYIYGLGERFTNFVKNGQVVDIWNKDGGTSSEQAYKNVPFYISNKGYGVFVNNPGLVSFEVASEKVNKVQFSVKGESLEYFVIGGEDLKDVLNNYTTLTGKPALPPAWSFGLWLSTSFTTNYDEETVNEFIDGMDERDIPLSVFHYDCFWMEALHWTDFTWDKEMFPDPEGMLKRLKEKGLKISVWINPYIAQESRLFAEAAEKGYLLKKPNGDIWQWDKWQPGMGIVDFTNPEACEWYASHIRRLADMGVDSFKTDFGERIPTDVVYYNGADPHKMHNYYTYLYNKVVFEALEDKLGEGNAVLFARSATTGGQQFPVHWGGDCDATYESMAESLRGGLSLGLGGFGFWSHDIGGFENTASPDVFKRWLAFGLLSSHSRLHGSKSYRVPWAYDEESVDVARFFTNLKCKLMPYLFDSAVESTKLGVPMMRAMILEFLEDPAVDTLDRQYMLGDTLLVAPVLDKEGNVSFYLPEGRWTHLLTNKVVEGGKWQQEQYDYFGLPLYVRPNSLLAMGAVKDRPDYDYADDVELHLFELEEGKSTRATVHNTKAELELDVEATREGNQIIFKVRKASGKAWNIVLRNITDVQAVEHGDSEKTDEGVKIKVEPDTAVVTITL